MAESTRLCLELFAAVPNSHGAAHKDMIEHLGMRESREIHGLVIRVDHGDTSAKDPSKRVVLEEALTIPGKKNATNGNKQDE